MKKVIYTIFALSAVMACSKMSEGKQEVPQVNDEQTTSEILPGVKYEEFTINTESQTKTVLDGLSCKWSVGDKLSVITNYEGQTTSNSFAMAPGQTDGVFSGQVPEGTTEFFAVYGNGSSYNMANGNLSATVTVPTTQTAVKDGFDPNAHIAVGYGVKQAEGASSAHLANFIRLVMISVPENVTSVTLSSNTAIAGSMTLNCTSEGALTMSGNANANSVTLNASNGVIEPGTYYLCVAPVDMVGFKMTYTFTDGSTYTKTSAKTLEMASSTQIRNLKLDFNSIIPTISISGCLTSYNYAVGDGVDKNVNTANSTANNAMESGKVTIDRTEGWDGYTYGYNDGTNHDGETEIPASTKPEWKEYDYYGYINVAGKTIKDTIKRYITGLPYNKNNQKIENFKGDWKISGGNYRWQDSYLDLRQNTKTTFKGFFVPNNISINVSYDLGTYCSTAFSYEITKLTVGGNLLVNRNNRNNTGEWQNDKATSATTITKENNSIIIETQTNSGGGSSFGASHSRIRYIGAIYR